MTAQQLRKSILQMAVQGKLVPQDPSDEPAHILLERIRAEKERLIKEKKIKKEKNPSVIYRGTDNLHYEKFADGTVKCIEDEIPFEIPESWGWERIRNIGTIIRGNGIKRSEIIEDGFPCVRYGEIYTTYNISFRTTNSFISEEVYGKSKRFSHGDILMTLTGENKPDIAKAVAYLGEQRVAASGDLAVWTAHGMYPLYLSYLLAAPYLIDQKIQQATGNIIVHISGEKIGEILITIPPLNEQKRIVQKVQKLEIALEEYQEKEHILTNLQCAFPDTLKKSVLQWAVQGKLVQQDENDEPASLLLEQIQAEKEELIRQGKIKRDKRESVIYRGTDNSYYERFADGSEKCIDEEIPFEIPKGWAWTHLSDITQILNGDRGQNYPAKNKLITKGVPFVSASNIESGVVSSNNLLCMTEEQYDALRAGKLIDNDIVYCIRGSLGKCGVFTMSKGAIASSLAIIRPFHTLYILREYLFLYLNSPLARSEIQKYDNGSAQPNLAAKDLMNFLVPLPPPMEAKMIVQKVKNIFTRVEGINAASM